MFNSRKPRLCVLVVSVVWTFIECEKDKLPPLSPFPTSFLPSGSFDHPSKSLFLVGGEVSLASFSWSVMNLCMVKFFDSTVKSRSGKYHYHQHRGCLVSYCSNAMTLWLLENESSIKIGFWFMGWLFYSEFLTEQIVSY